VGEGSLRETSGGGHPDCSADSEQKGRLGYVVAVRRWGYLPNDRSHRLNLPGCPGCEEEAACGA
jgi:hypothetical protein